MKTFKYIENINEYMATITINLNNQVSEKFREVVKKEKGNGKGILGQAVEEALILWIKEKEDEDIANRQLKLLQSKGFKMGKLKKYSRGELHKRHL